MNSFQFFMIVNACIFDRAATHGATHDYAPILRQATKVIIEGEIPQQKVGSLSRKEVLAKASKGDRLLPVRGKCDSLAIESVYSPEE